MESVVLKRVVGSRKVDCTVNVVSSCRDLAVSKDKEYSAINCESVRKCENATLKSFLLTS